MTQQHPITPPPELIQRWSEQFEAGRSLYTMFEDIYRAGADTELEACIAWFDRHIPGYELVADRLRTARRPKPPSLKELALQALNDAVKMADDAPPEGICSDQADIIRRALEQLDD